MVCVLNKDGKPLMPTNRHGRIRKLLNSGKAIVVRRKPFTVQLIYETPDAVQPVTLGVDTGYSHIGVSAVTDSEEIFAAQVDLLQGQKKRIDDKRRYRRTRRNRLRHRKPRFNNRRRKPDWLPPSAQHKIDSHARLVTLIKSLLPVSEVRFEVGHFDLHQMKRPDIKPWEYAKGELYGADTLREYIFNRDGHTCQLCYGKSGNDKLVTHHVYYWKGRHGSNPGELITLCESCNAPANHLPGGPLYGWDPQPELKQLGGATFMNVLAVRLAALYEDAAFTCGEVTAEKRDAYGITKSHANDAFVIAGGNKQKRVKMAYVVVQNRRNNRSLETLREARYVDSRDGLVKTGKVLFSGRVRRPVPPKDANLRQYRQRQVSKGEWRIRKRRYPFQPGDLVRAPNGVQVVAGTTSGGNSVKFHTCARTYTPRKLTPVKYGKGFNFNTLGHS